MMEGLNLQEQERKYTDDERAFLESWNRHDLIAQNDALFGDPEEQPNPRGIDDGHTGDMDPFTRDDAVAAHSLPQERHKGLTDIQRSRAQAAQDGDSDLDVNVDAAREAEAALKANPTPLRGANDAPELRSQSSASTDQYDDMTNSDLREELGRRELSKAGTKDVMVARLREDDTMKSGDTSSDDED